MDRHEEFLTLFLRHQADLKAFLGAMVRDRHAVDDLLQESALALWRGFDRYDPSRPFGAWARGVAANLLLKHRDRSRRVPAPFSPESVQAVLDAFARTEDQAESGAAPEALERCLERLPERSRHLLALRYEMSLTLQEMAARLETTLDAVHKTLSRLRAALQQCIEQRREAALEGFQ